MNGEELIKGTRLVARRDPKMGQLIKRVGPIQLRDPLDDSFAALVRSIMYQQLAGAAAAAIHGRFLKLFDDGLSPAGVLALQEGAMRTAGVSGSKSAAITDLAQKVADGRIIKPPHQYLLLAQFLKPKPRREFWRPDQDKIGLTGKNLEAQVGQFTAQSFTG